MSNNIALVVVIIVALLVVAVLYFLFRPKRAKFVGFIHINIVQNVKISEFEPYGYTGLLTFSVWEWKGEYFLSPGYRCRDRKRMGIACSYISSYNDILRLLEHEQPVLPIKLLISITRLCVRYRYTFDRTIASMQLLMPGHIVWAYTVQSM